MRPMKGPGDLQLSSTLGVGRRQEPTYHPCYITTQHNLIDLLSPGVGVCASQTSFVIFWEIRFVDVGRSLGRVGHGHVKSGTRRWKRALFFL